MLGVCLRKLCPQDSFGYAFRNKKLYENGPPEGAKPARGGSKMACGSGFFVQVGPTWPPRPLGSRLWAALGALLEPSWGLLGRSWGVLGPSWAPLGGRFWPSRGLICMIWTMSVALREIQQKPDILQCFFACMACGRGPKPLQNRPGRPLGRLVGPKIGLEGPS